MTSIYEAIKFVETLHEEPKNFKPGMSPDWGRVPPHFVPIGLTRSIPIKPQLRISQTEQINPFFALEVLLYRTYGVTCTRVFCSQSLKAHEKEIQPGVKMLPRRAVASGGACYPTDISIWIPNNTTGYFSTWRGETLAYAPQYNRLFALEQTANTKHLRPVDFGLNCSDQSLVVILSLDFERTYPKYRDFTYRLSAVDIGVVLGRLCQMAQPDWKVRLYFDFDFQQVQQLINRKNDRCPVYVLATLTPPKACFSSHCPALEKHDPVVYSFGNERIQAEQFSEEFLSAHFLAEANSYSFVAFDVTASNKTTLNFAKTAIVLPNCCRIPLQLQSNSLTNLDIDIWRRTSQAHAYTGYAAKFDLLVRCLVSMTRMIITIQDLSKKALISKPTLLVSILNVHDVDSGLYLVTPDAAYIEEIGSFTKKRALSDALYLKSFDIQKAAFVVHVLDQICDPNTNRGFRDYRIRQMTVGAMLDAGMLACVEKNISAHAYLGFSARRVEEFYGLSNTEHQVVAQLCVGVTRSGSQLDVGIVG